MAIYYFDRNGTTAGFGTLTGDWDTTTASWTNDSTGVAAPSAITFTNSDTAQFGITGTSGAAGTATIIAGLTVTLNKIVTQNIGASTQIIAGSDATTSILTFSGTTPTIDVQNTGGLTISARVSGSESIDKTGANSLIFSGSLSNFTGTMSLTNGLLIIESSSVGSMTISHSTAGIRASKSVFLRPTVTNGYSFPAGFNLVGDGTIHISNTNLTSLTTGYTFPAGATAGLTGTSAGTTAGGATAGLALITEGSVASIRTVTVNLNDLPSVLTFEFNYNTTNIALTQNLYYISSSATHNYGTRFDVLNWNGTTAIGTGSHTVNFYASQGTGPLILSGGFNRASITAYTATLSLRGDSFDDNEVSGNITQASGTLAIAKNDSGRWILSGTNTYTGANTLTAGTLNVRSAAALGSSAATSATTLTAGTLQIQGGITINKASSAWALNGSIIENVSGTNVITAASWTIGTTQSIVITAGSLQVTNAIAGTNTRTLTKSGDGVLYLSNTASGYLGTVTVSTGELQVQNVANAGVACSLGTQGTAQATITMGDNTTFTHRGTTADSTDRNITCNGAAGSSLSLDSSGSGSGAITLSSGGTLGFSTSGLHTLTFMGNNSATNTCARTIGDATGGGAVAITKGGGNTWLLTGSITSTGLVTCSEGTLNLGSTNRTFSGGLLVNSTVASPTQTFGAITITTGNTISANTTMECGTITAVLAGANTLTVTSSAVEVRPALLQPDDSTNGNNTFTGNATINGCLDIVTPDAVSPSTAGKGRVLGTSNTVTVSSTGILRTKFTDTSNQRASARYNNLTFQSGSNLKIGYAN
jgi:fibronectin-binding autotransporter adhesin